MAIIEMTDDWRSLGDALQGLRRRLGIETGTARSPVKGALLPGQSNVGGTPLGCETEKDGTIARPAKSYREVVKRGGEPALPVKDGTSREMVAVSRRKQSYPCSAAIISLVVEVKVHLRVTTRCVAVTTQPALVRYRGNEALRTSMLNGNLAHLQTAVVVSGYAHAIYVISFVLWQRQAQSAGAADNGVPRYAQMCANPARRFLAEMLANECVCLGGVHEAHFTP